MITQTISDVDIQAFAVISGDYNRVHFDDAAARAAGGGFTGHIAHGHLCGAIVSTLLAMEYPGCILLSEARRFCAAVYPGDIITAEKLSAEEVPDKPGWCKVMFVVKNQHGKNVITGDALVLLAKEKGN